MWRLRHSLSRPVSRRPCLPRLRVRAFVADAAAPPAAPTSADLLRDSRLAALSGLAYVPPDELAERLRQHGLELQAHGSTHFTRWYVARPSLEAVHAAASPSAAAGSRGASPQAASPAAQAASLGALDREQRYVFLRGVSWRSADLDALRVWQGLARALPTPFQPHLTSPPELLLAHSGVADMAAELFDVLRPHLEGGGRLHVAGHSLGGSLATLVALAAHLRLGSAAGSRGEGAAAATAEPAGPNGRSGGRSGGSRAQPARLAVQCTTFGSPPVLALAKGPEDDGRSILEALRLPLGAVRNYVLQDDPIPRAMLSADPAFLALKQSAAVAGLLQLRERWLGPGLLSPTRFLYHPAGDVYLVRWNAEAGHSVRLLAPSSLQQELALDVEALRASPLALMQAILDHHHGSYSSELRAAAAALARREGGSAAAPG